MLGDQLRGAIRSLLRAPGFSLATTLTLALGIGLSTAVFTVADSLLLRRLPVGDQDRVVVLWGETRDGRFSNFPLALTDVREFQRRARSLDEVAFFAFRGAVPNPIRYGDRVHPIRTALVSGNFFDVLRSRAVLGRGLRVEDDVVGAAPVLVLSHRAWQRWFGGDSTVVGRSIKLLQSGRSFTIVGVMPRGLEYPRGTELWAPAIAYSAAGGFLDIVTGELDLLARLRPQATATQARDELTSFFGRRDAPASHRDVRGVVHSFPDIVLGATKPAVLLVTIAAALLLLIACVNVANLLLVRALARVRELVVRSALGASRGRIVVQLLAESALLAGAAGVTGTAVAVATVRAFLALAPANLPRLDEIGVHRAVLLAALVVTALATLVSGLGPALFTSRVNAQDALRAGQRHSRGRSARSATEALVVAQIALAAVSLAAAVLVLRSLINLQRVELAFQPARLVVASLALRQDQLPAAEQQSAALELVLARARALPGVHEVTPAFAVPFVGAGGGIDGRLGRPGETAEQAAANPMLNFELAAPNYFAVLGIPLLRGRSFTDQDRAGAAPVIIVSNTVARHFWPDRDPIGQRLALRESEFTVVGVVPDTRYRELTTARPTVYFPLGREPFSGLVPTTLLLRTSGSPGNIVTLLRRALSEARGVELVGAPPVETLLDAPRAQPRLNAIVLALFAAAAVSLAAIGLFAIIATMVRQRTHELGIRLALGATSTDLRTLVMRRGLTLAATGAIIGVAGAIATRRLLASLVFDISPSDATTLGGVVAFMLFVAAVASFVPARASTRVDPSIALRSEG